MLTVLRLTATGPCATVSTVSGTLLAPLALLTEAVKQLRLVVALLPSHNNPPGFEMRRLYAGQLRFADPFARAS